jgi:hypothetical protein
MSTREYKLAGDPVQWSIGPMREVLEFIDGQSRMVIAVVPDGAAMDVLEVVRRAYRDGREDRSEELFREQRRDGRGAGSPATA